MFIGQYYRNEFAARLVEKGYSLETKPNGLFDLRGIDETLKEAFSSRSEQISVKMSELRKDYPIAKDQKLREMATLGSRVAKRDVDMSLVRESWNTKLNELGYTREGIAQTVKEAGQQAEAGKNRAKRISSHETVSMTAEIITLYQSVFAKEDLLWTAAALSVGIYRGSELERIFRLMVKKGELIKSGGKYTTPEIQRIEAENVQFMKTGQGQENPIMTHAETTNFVQSRYARFTNGQKAAFTNILTARDRIIGVQGYAGTGKTTLFKAIREQAELHGFKVLGLSFTGKAAEELQKNSGIESRTIDSFLSSNGKMESNAIYILDEASMIGSRHMNRLERMAKESKARLVLSGDTKQLPAISAGCPFAELQRNGMSTSIMGEIVRQKDGTYQEIVKDITDVKIDNAFDKLIAHDRLKVIPDRNDRIAEIMKTFTTDGNWRDTIITTNYNADRAELNGKIRETLKERGELTGQDISVTVRVPKSLSALEQHFAQSYQQGDHVFTRFAGNGMKAGAEGRILETDNQAHTLVIEKSATGDKVEIDLRTAGETISVFQERKISLTMGEKVVFLKNDAHLDLKNGRTAEFKGVNQETGKLMFSKNNGEVEFSTEQYNYLDYAYARTVYKGQGVTERNVIVHAPANSQSYNSFYVGMTRGQYDVKVYTDDQQALRERVKTEIEKSSSYQQHDRVETSISGKHPTQDSGKDQDHELSKVSARGKVIELEM